MSGRERVVLMTLPHYHWLVGLPRSVLSPAAVGAQSV